MVFGKSRKLSSTVEGFGWWMMMKLVERGFTTFPLSFITNGYVNGYGLKVIAK